MANVQAQSGKVSPEKKARNEEETAREMAPFAIYAAIPILITICIAFYFGSL